MTIINDGLKFNVLNSVSLGSVSEYNSKFYAGNDDPTYLLAEDGSFILGEDGNKIMSEVPTSGYTRVLFNNNSAKTTNSNFRASVMNGLSLGPLINYGASMQHRSSASMLLNPISSYETIFSPSIKSILSEIPSLVTGKSFVINSIVNLLNSITAINNVAMRMNPSYRPNSNSIASYSSSAAWYLSYLLGVGSAAFYNNSASNFNLLLASSARSLGVYLESLNNNFGLYFDAKSNVLTNPCLQSAIHGLISSKPYAEYRTVSSFDGISNSNLNRVTASYNSVFNFGSSFVNIIDSKGIYSSLYHDGMNISLGIVPSGLFSSHLQLYISKLIDFYSSSDYKVHVYLGGDNPVLYILAEDGSFILDEDGNKIASENTINPYVGVLFWYDSNPNAEMIAFYRIVSNPMFNASSSYGSSLLAAIKNNSLFGGANISGALMSVIANNMYRSHVNVGYLENFRSACLLNYNLSLISSYVSLMSLFSVNNNFIPWAASGRNAEAAYSNLFNFASSSGSSAFSFATRLFCNAIMGQRMFCESNPINLFCMNVLPSNISYGNFNVDIGSTGRFILNIDQLAVYEGELLSQIKNYSWNIFYKDLDVIARLGIESIFRYNILVGIFDLYLEMLNNVSSVSVPQMLYSGAALFPVSYSLFGSSGIFIDFIKALMSIKFPLIDFNLQKPSVEFTLEN